MIHVIFSISLSEIIDCQLQITEPAEPKLMYLYFIITTTTDSTLAMT